MAFNPLTILSNFGAIKDKVPQLLAGFLDNLLEDNKQYLKTSDNETQIFFVMFPTKTDNEKKYYISIVAADDKNTIKRSLKTFALDDILTTIFEKTK